MSDGRNWRPAVRAKRWRVPLTSSTASSSASSRTGPPSGWATIAAGTKSKVVTPGVDLTPASLVLVTLMGNPGTTVYLHRVAANVTADTFTVYLTANATAATRFAWFVIG